MIILINHSETDFNEKTVLSKIINNPELITDFVLSPEYFKDVRHQNIAEFIQTDSDFTKEKLKTQAIMKPQEFGDYDFLNGIIEDYFSTPHQFTSHQEEVYKLYKHRTIHERLNEYASNPNDDSLDAIRYSIDKLDYDTPTNIDTKKETLKKLHKRLYGDILPSIIPTKYKKIDRVIDGFTPNQFNILAARPSTGKTALALNLAMNMQSDDVEVVFISLETSEENLTDRIMSSLTGVHLKKFKSPTERMTLDEADKVNDELGKYQNMNIRINQDGHTPNDVRRIINGMDRDSHKLVIIDYLQLMKSNNKTNNRQETVADISRELKIMSNAYEDLTILAISQLSRGIESRGDKTPTMSDLRESGQLEQDANIIMMLSRSDDDEDDPTVNEIELHIVKNKDGPLGMVKMDFYKQNQRMY